MTLTQSKVTPQSAPRDAEGLMKLGIFQLRLLIEGMGALSTEQEKMAFAKMATPEKVQLAQQKLNEWDKANGSNGVGVPAMPAPPMAMQPPQGMPVMQVDPGQVAAAAQAAVPPPPVPAKRSPATAESARASGADLGVDILNLLNRIVAQNDETNSTLASAFKELSGNVAEVAKANSVHAENYKAVYGALQNMNAAISLVALQSKLAMALVLPLAEQVLGGSREDILRMTLGDVDSVQAFIQQATTPGKG